jgi:hypothetical protein
MTQTPCSEEVSGTTGYPRNWPVDSSGPCVLMDMGVQVPLPPPAGSRALGIGTLSARPRGLRRCSASARFPMPSHARPCARSSRVERELAWLTVSDHDDLVPIASGAQRRLDLLVENGEKLVSRLRHRSTLSTDI